MLYLENVVTKRQAEVILNDLTNNNIIKNWFLLLKRNIILKNQKIIFKV
jgi:hypothetical protein